jgi:predicted rRNA methylase YqxC with S4 and FtsJ domains
MDPWRLKNRRRIRLIEKQHAGQLTEGETAELATLESQFSAHLMEVAPRSREVLDEFSDFVAKMKAKVAAKKKGIKP